MSGNGLIDKREFVKAMQILTSPRTKSNVNVADYEALFESFDKDGSGEIDYNEMSKLLRCDGCDHDSVTTRHVFNERLV